MPIRFTRFLTISVALCAASALSLSACGGSQTNNLAPPPRPPDPAQITLNPIRITRSTPTSTPAGATATTPPPTTGRGRRAPPPAPMSIETAQSVLAVTNEAVRACYKGLLALSPQSGGSIVALMRVNPDGSVSDVEPIGNTDPSLLLMMPCVLNAVRTRRFPPSRSASLMSYPYLLRSGEVGGSQANAIIDMPRARPGEIQVPNPEPITVRPWRPTLVPNTNPVRTLTRDMAAESAADMTGLVDTCFSAAMVMIPTISGQFNLRIAVEPSGNVSRVEVLDQNTLAGPLRECVVVLGRRLQFHSSGGGAVVSADVTLSQSDAPAAAPMGAMPGGPTAAPMGAFPGGPAATIGRPTNAAPSGGLMPLSGAPR